MGSGAFYLPFFLWQLIEPCDLQELGLIRKPAAFISTISDERGQELLYAGMRISEVFREDIGIGGVVSLLWFKRRGCFLPKGVNLWVNLCALLVI